MFHPWNYHFASVSPFIFCHRLCFPKIWIKWQNIAIVFPSSFHTTQPTRLCNPIVVVVVVIIVVVVIEVVIEVVIVVEVVVAIVAVKGSCLNPSNPFTPPLSCLPMMYSASALLLCLKAPPLSSALPQHFATSSLLFNQPYLSPNFATK